MFFLPSSYWGNPQIINGKLWKIYGKSMEIYGMETYKFPIPGGEISGGSLRVDGPGAQVAVACSESRPELPFGMAEGESQGDPSVIETIFRPK